MGYQESTKQMQTRAAEIFSGGMELADLFVNKNYLIGLDRCEPLPLEAAQKSFSYLSLFEISKIVYDKQENINDKLVSVYSALSNFGSTALLVLFSDESGVRFYLGTRDTRQPNVAKAILQKSLRGNFPGIEMTDQSSSQVARLLEEHIPDVYSNMAVSAVSIVPSPRDDDKDHFIQGLEKFIDAMAGEKYTAMFISTPLSKEALENKKRGYEELYSALSQCAQVSMTYGENDSESVAKGISESFSTSVNEGVSSTTGTSESTSTGTNTSVNKNRNHGNSFGFFGMNQNFGSGSGTSKGTSTGTTSGTSTSRAETTSKGESSTKGTSDTSTKTTGSTATIAITRQNKTVQALMARIDEQLERIKKCESYGLWDSACYFIADTTEVSIVAANTFKAIVAGEKTSVENSFINLWDNDYANADHSLTVLDSLRYGIHPRFTYLPPARGGVYTPQVVTPASMISGVELPVLMGFPHKSVSGVTSITQAEFGRNVFSKEMGKAYRNVNLGAIFHMGETFGSNRVRMNLESLTGHALIVGSTGSGKSNTVYKIIDEVTSSRNGVKFLVIEPAKGEYKLAFGALPGIHIFTTNPKYHEMLRINPFEFRPEVHVLEHLDRLIEIFSACWPLYAAMPALLKASFEQAYIAHGWDLNESIYIDRGNGKFPSFRDIVEILPDLLDKSEFSSQTKGDYIGSLVTRVTSLTNGLLGQIFTQDPVEERVLFDENTIVDLSLIGSAETKALLMGVLVLKLNEYRQATAVGTDQPLKHITILEEAHNLLKRTSTSQSQESSNVQGKSVEMISNSIAEMRTYGEGFLIVDQSPTALDISAIKNTNTKIVMRLPEAEDCAAVGHAIGLNEDQIRELSRLDRGVAAVFQNDWLETVLMKVDLAGRHYRVTKVPVRERKPRLQLAGELIAELVAQDESNDFNVGWLNDIINSSRVSEGTKVRYRRMIQECQQKRKTGNKREAYNALVYQILGCGDLLRMFEDKLPPLVRKNDDITREVRRRCDEWVDCILDHLGNYADFPDKKTLHSAFFCVLLHKAKTEKYDKRYKIVLYCI